MSAFCDPATTTSSPHASVSSGTAPRLETASTTTSAPALARDAARATATSATTPVDVSECTRTTTSRSRLLEPRAEVLGPRRLSPCVAKLVDVGAVRARERRPAVAELAGRDDEDALSRGEEVHDRRLERAGSRRR